MTLTENKIKFSHEYLKLWGWRGSSAMLLQVFKVHYKDLSVPFIHYDTGYLAGDPSYDLHTEYYELPKTDLLVLIFGFIGSKGAFTTIRRWTPEKEKYYRGKVGQDFEIVLTEEKT